MLDSAVRAHRKHLTSVQAAVSKIGFCGEVDKDQTAATPPPSPRGALEQGDHHITLSKLHPSTFISSYVFAKDTSQALRTAYPG